jgi:hypothetical protein
VEISTVIVKLREEEEFEDDDEDEDADEDDGKNPNSKVAGKDKEIADSLQYHINKI